MISIIWVMLIKLFMKGSTFPRTLHCQYQRRTIPSNETEFNEINGGFLKISVGLRRKRLKISKYPTKPMELGKHAAPFRRPSPRMDTNGFSPCCMENKVCRKPELILEMLKNKR
jgi:hypothetical protein